MRSEKLSKQLRVSEKIEIAEKLLWRMPAFRNIALFSPAEKEQQEERSKAKQAGKKPPKKKHLEDVVEVLELDVNESTFQLRQALEILNQLRNRYSHYARAKHRNISFAKIKEIVQAAKKELIDRFPRYTEENIKALISESLSLLNRKNTLSIYGQIFLICQFLDRGTAFAFLRNIEGFRPSENLQQRAKLNLFTIFCSRLPRPKLGSSDIELDMLNELRRVPKNLYTRLSTVDQKLFERIVENLPDEEEEEEMDNAMNNKVIMHRHQNRFPYFVLRYFETLAEPLPTLRFQLKLGKLRRLDKAYDKKIGGIERQRKIIEDIHTFAHLAEISEETLPKQWKMYDPATRTKILDPAIEQFSPRYHIVSRKIALKFVTQGEKTSYPLPKIVKSGQHIEKVELDMPDAILSIHELGNFFLYDYLYRQGKIHQDIETFLKNYIQHFRDFCWKVNNGDIQPVCIPADFEKQYQQKGKDGYDENQKAQLKARQALFAQLMAKHGLLYASIPDRMREYLMGYQKEKWCDAAKRQLNDRISSVNKRIKQAEKGKNPDGSPLNKGDIATWLAKDITFFKPPNEQKRGKPNDEQFNELQKMIAYFAIEKTNLIAYIQDELNLTGEDIEYTHPFLFRTSIPERRGVFDFYESYLKQKKKYLQRVDRQLKEEKEENIKKKYGYWLRVDERSGQEMNYLTISNAHNDAKRTAPVVLPRALFNASILNALKNELNLKSTDNVSFAIQAYFNDAQQTFYQRKRIYERNIASLDGEEKEILAVKGNWEVLKGELQQISDNIDELLKEDEPKQQITLNSLEGLSEQIADDSDTKEYRAKDLKKLHRWITDNEKSIRLQLKEDRLLWLMIKDIFDRKYSQQEDDSSPLEGWELKGIGFDEKENNLLDRQTLFPMSVSLHERTVTDELAIKHYGKFRRFTKDRRLWDDDRQGAISGLLHYYEEGTQIPRLELKAALDNYELGRENLIEKVLELEKKVADEQYRERLDKFCKEQAALCAASEDKQLQSKANKYQESSLSHFILLEFVEDLFGTLPTELTRDQLATLRNKFFHNEIPAEDWLQEKLSASAPKDVPTAMIDMTIKEYDRLIQAL